LQGKQIWVGNGGRAAVGTAARPSAAKSVLELNQTSKVIGRVVVEMLIKQIGLNERSEPSDPCRILVESHWQDGESLPSRH
jgi:hypothetical protein